MQQVLVPSKCARILEENKGLINALSKKLKCEIKIEDGNQIRIEGEAYDEYNAKNVLSAFGRGFDIDTAYALLSDECFFTSINLKEIFKSEDQIKRIKGRIIGKEGKSKTYIEAVSGARLCVYGNTVSLIGSMDEIKVADTALQILLDGGTHKKAYRIMERVKRSLTNNG